METQTGICEKCKYYFFTDEQNVTHGFVRLETCKREHFNKLIKKFRTEEVLTCKDFEEIETAQ
jgi:Zn-finger protein